MTIHPPLLVLGANGRFGAAAVAGLRRRRLARAGAGAARAGRAAAARRRGRRRARSTDTEALAAPAAGAQRRRPRRQPALHPLGRRGAAAARARAWRSRSAWARTSCCRATSTTSARRMPALLREDTPQRPTHAQGRASAWRSRPRLRGRARAGALRERGHPRRRLLRRRQRLAGSTWRSPSRCARASWSTPARWTCRMPGPTCPTWRAPSSRWPRAGDAPAFAALHFAGHTLTGARTARRARTRPPPNWACAPARGFRHGGMPWGLIRAVGLVRARCGANWRA